LIKKTVVSSLLLLASSVYAETEHKVYDRALPFYAQEAVDKGYNLPKPYGVALIYNYTEQDFVLDDLSLFTKDGTPIELDEIVALRNAKPASHSVQVKVDTFVFPFLNVFGMAGVISGETPLDITITRRDGKPDIEFSVDAAVSGYNFTAGMMFATAYKHYFVSVPITYTYSMLERSYDYRKVVSIVPRFGNIMSLQEYGKVAVFIGANYMDVDLSSKGEFTSDDGTKLVYDIHQKNVDKWNMSLGYNWMMNQAFAWNLEVGFLGSRQNLTTGLNYRF